MSNRKRILWLVSWYPNRYEPFDGDFIQRHAQAAAIHHDIHVLFVTQAPRQKKKEVITAEEGGLTEQIVYLPKAAGGLGKVLNHSRWRATYQKEIDKIISQHRPHLVHVHVPWKAGLMAVWVKKKYGIPYLVTEHWGIYNDVVDDNIYRRPFWVRSLLKRIFAEAVHFLSVSRYVGDGVSKTLVQKEYSLVPNVVDATLFKPSSTKYERFTFLHVSNGAALKNVSGIIQAFRDFSIVTGANTQLVLVGDHQLSVKDKEALSAESIVVRGEVPYASVAREMQQSHVFVLNSYIENSPCVIGEALCCGMPVIATCVGGVPELVTSQNGLLIPSNNTAALAAAMQKMYESWGRWNAGKIAGDAKQKFSKAAVAEVFNRFYTAN
jgi:glycosyltransferase involved in cell wall biosynthesis